MNAEKTMADVSKFARIPLVDTDVHVSLVMNSDRTTKTVKVRQRERKREREKPTLKNNIYLFNYLQH